MPKKKTVLKPKYSLSFDVGNGEIKSSGASVLDVLNDALSGVGLVNARGKFVLKKGSKKTQIQLQATNLRRVLANGTAREILAKRLENTLK